MIDKNKEYVKQLTKDELLEMYLNYNDIKFKHLSYQIIDGKLCKVYHLTPQSMNQQDCNHHTHNPQSMNQQDCNHHTHNPQSMSCTPSNTDKLEFRFLRSLNEKRYRCHKKINYLLSHFKYSYFCTLTLNEETLNRFTYDTLLIYAKRCIKNTCNCYVGNVDYGAKNGRLHFHFVLGSDTLITSINWIYGFSSLLPVRCKDDYIKLANYITKLTYHALKNGIHTRLIYSR